MGLILDTSVVIARERRGDTVAELLRSVRTAYGEADAALSAVTVVELTHGIYRARTARDREVRAAYTRELFRSVPVHPFTFEIAQIAGRIEGEQAALGNKIAFEDLAIGATALFRGFGVATLNVRHFERIPGLTVLGIR